MVLHIINTIWHLPMVWDLIVPLAVLSLFCAVLFWEGEYGHAPRKHYRLKFKH